MLSRREYQELFYSFFTNYVHEFMIDPLYFYPSLIQKEYWKWMTKLYRRNINRPMEMTCALNAQYDYHNYQMNEEELNEYNQAQLKEIEKYRKHLEEVENRPYTIEEAIEVWAMQHSARFRKYWHLRKALEVI